MDSPDQGVKGIPTSLTYCSDDSVAIFIPMIGASFNGLISENKISGTFKQSGYEFPLILEPEQSEENRRPQTPHPPYPYEEQPVEIAINGAVLDGTLSLPENPKAAVVFVTGSGPQNRDEEIFEHKPFRLLADRLARAGIASLRYDDRGVGKSTGNFAAATTFTFCADASAAVTHLRTMGMTCPIGIIGHSEGGTIAFMLAAEGMVDFAVSLAGAAQSGLDILVEQNRDALIAMNISGPELEHSVIFIREYLKGFGAGKKPDAQRIIKEKALSIPDIVIQQAVKDSNTLTSPWFSTFITLEPADYISKIKCPLLAVNGTLDTQVKTTLNLPVIRQMLPNATIKEYSGLNHLFQHAITGSMAEYGEISETFAEEVIADIISFIYTSL